VAIAGVAPDFVKVDPHHCRVSAMVREVEFDVCELASTTYFIARAFGAPFKALPIFLMRRFHHDGIVCREDAASGDRRTSKAKRWECGPTRDHRRVDAGSPRQRVRAGCVESHWVVDDEEHVTQLRLPPMSFMFPPANRSSA